MMESSPLKRNKSNGEKENERGSWRGNRRGEEGKEEGEIEEEGKLMCCQCCEQELSLAVAPSLSSRLGFGETATMETTRRRECSGMADYGDTKEMSPSRAERSRATDELV